MLKVPRPCRKMEPPICGFNSMTFNVITWAIEAFPDLVIELKCFLSMVRNSVPDLFEVVDSVPTSDANVYDARLRPFNSRSYASRSYVSVFIMRDTKDAFALERTMHKVDVITGKDCVLGTKLIVNRNQAVETRSPHHCLITDRIPEQTVAMFLAENPLLNTTENIATV
ncbi:hypothetical protein POM88_005624 [Heracleum sosnowskyi]|uniref:Uncharacterized protein n=1 Tax=Heracleum sosnowskyi TaxID=360622 RepID=A0AAD8N4L9_9APIA|nr:hypothetical protein POM88_005624 [Heracleum sosnowskyi]